MAEIVFPFCQKNLGAMIERALPAGGGDGGGAVGKPWTRERVRPLVEMAVFAASWPGKKT